MAYETTTIRSVLERINRTHFLPAIQRPFVWEPAQIIALFDSIMKGYPISSFLFWLLKPENKDSIDIYKFVENFAWNSTHNELIDPTSRDVVLVLDGQQRLTSFLIGLKGSYTVKRKHMRATTKEAWIRQKLYLDLLKDPIRRADDLDDDVGDETDIGVSYGFRFFEDEPSASLTSCWMRVSRVLEFDDEDQFDRFKDDLIEALPGETTKEQERTIRRNLSRLYQVIWKDNVIAFYTESSQDVDRVLDIFVRANDGGTKLSKSDLLLSMITAKWEDTNARDEIYSFVDYLNFDLDRKNELNKDFIMRACLVLSDLDPNYDVRNFTRKNLEIIRARWPKIKQALEWATRLINRLGIDKETLISSNAIQPIAYYLLKLGAGGLDGTTAFESNNAELIRRWLLGSQLTGVFGGASNVALSSSRNVIKKNFEQSKEFPYRELVQVLQRRGRTMEFAENNMQALLDRTYKDRACFLALSLIYESTNWGAANYHIDHIIPRSLAATNQLIGRGLSQERIEMITECVDKIGNLQILLARENGEKSNLPFGDWIKTRDGGFLERHLIPPEPSLWAIEQLPEFVMAREQLIRQRVQSITKAALPDIMPTSPFVDATSS